MGGNRQHPNGSIVRNYSFAEIIGKSGIYFYDTIRVGLFVQAPWNDYPAHAHDSEEWLVLIVLSLLTRRLMGSTDQADPSCIYFRIS